MGKLIQIVARKKQKIVAELISKNIYQATDRSYLLELPLKNLESILLLRTSPSQKADL
ncbi:hypothetical protein [Peribacillus sp. NPDC097295]|uniref:hypothetical protein n=1 Tax=Peribacillus sp. NPDC097295 TaxID=3364402 RepID=UPI0037F57C64